MLFTFLLSALKEAWEEHHITRALSLTFFLACAHPEATGVAN